MLRLESALRQLLGMLSQAVNGDNKTWVCGTVDGIKLGNTHKAFNGVLGLYEALNHVSSSY